MPLGRVIAETVADLRERVEVSSHHDTWHVTASSFEAALRYAEERFDHPVVLARRDHGHRGRRVTLEVSTDPARAATAPPLSELAHPPEPVPTPPAEPVQAAEPGEPASAEVSGLSDLEAIFAHQNDAGGR